MFHCVYKTTNLVNGKIYIGVHSTKNIEDSYIGSGKGILKAIKKHGRDNFKKEILLILKTAKSAYIWEELIVNQHFIQRADTYNYVLGGKGGDVIKGNLEKQRLKSEKLSKYRLEHPMIKTPEHKELERQRMIQYNKNQRTGVPSTIRGKIAIYNESIDKQLYIFKTEELPDGYIKGQRPKSKEHKEKTRKKLTGVKRPQSVCEKISKTKRENNTKNLVLDDLL
jgi:hypothetical protein